MLKIRLRRTGAKKKPSYRVVVAESTSPRDGAFIEILGHYNPRTDPITFVLDEEKTRGWLQKGAQPSDRVARLLMGRGISTPIGEAIAAAAAAARSAAAAGAAVQ